MIMMNEIRRMIRVTNKITNMFNVIKITSKITKMFFASTQFEYGMQMNYFMLLEAHGW